MTGLQDSSCASPFFGRGLQVEESHARLPFPCASPFFRKELQGMKTQADRLAALYSLGHGEELPAEVAAEMNRNELEAADESRQHRPYLEMRVLDGHGRTKAELRINLTACVLAQGKVWYAESVCTSSATAQAIMGGLADPSVEPIWRLRWNPHTYDAKPANAWEKPDGWLRVECPIRPRIVDHRMAIDGWHGNLHHFAFCDRDPKLLFAKDDEALWLKLRETLSCPARKAWGKALMPACIEAQVIEPAAQYGLAENTRVYVVAKDAEPKFDALVGAHVRRIGGLKADAA